MRSGLGLDVERLRVLGLEVSGLESLETYWDMFSSGVGFELKALGGLVPARGSHSENEVCGIDTLHPLSKPSRTLSRPTREAVQLTEAVQWLLNIRKMKAKVLKMIVK